MGSRGISDGGGGIALGRGVLSRRGFARMLAVFACAVLLLGLCAGAARADDLSREVYVSNSGKYHYVSDCSGMKNYATMTLQEALAAGYDACNNCAVGGGSTDPTPLPEPSYPQTSTGFADVADGAWYATWVVQASQAGLMTGSDGLFAPEGMLTRGQVATVLYRMGTGSTGDASAPDQVSFIDTAGHWACGCIEWCYEQGLVTGYPDGRFGPDDAISRQELATMVARYAQRFAGVDVSGADRSAYDQCVDAGSEYSYATEYLAWTSSQGILSGSVSDDGTKSFMPYATATRAEAAKVFVVLQGIC